MSSDTFVPVERRWAGFDKRTVLPSAIVILLAVIYAVVLPQINSSTDYSHEIKAGDVVDLADGQLTMTPSVGWNLAQGGLVLKGPSTVSVPSVTQLVLQDVSFAVVTGPFTGTPTQLLEQINKISGKLRNRPNLGTATKRSSIATSDGVSGVADFYTGLQNQGFNAAFVYQVGGASVGVEVVVRGSDQSLTNNVQAVTSMLLSITDMVKAA
jgi:hypothetical protein